MRGFRERTEVDDVVRLLEERVRPLPEEAVRCLGQENCLFRKRTHALLQEADDLIDLGPLSEAPHAYVVFHVADGPAVDSSE